VHVLPEQHGCPLPPQTPQVVPHVCPDGHVVQVTPPFPHALSAVPTLHVVPEQQPMHEVSSHAHTPFSQCCPLPGQVPPVQTPLQPSSAPHALPAQLGVHPHTPVSPPHPQLSGVAHSLFAQQALPLPEPRPAPRCPPHMHDGLPWALTSTVLFGCAPAAAPSSLLERAPRPPRTEVRADAPAPSSLPKPPPAAPRPELEAVRTASVACHRSLGKYCTDNHCPATLDEAIARMACRAPPVLDCGPYRTITWSDGRSYFKGFYDSGGVLVGALAGSDSVDPRCGTLVHYGISVSCQERART
jgi:hypothetical protein